jgi:hypothetical protein
MMTLGDFFKSAPYARPVVPRPVKFRAICSERTLPGGGQNPAKQTIAEITACFTFLDGELVTQLRLAARRAMAEHVEEEARTAKRGEQEALQVISTDADFGLEFMYHMMQASLCCYDEKDKTAGDRMFPSVKLLRQLVAPAEMDRVLGLYHKYVREEHPEAVNPANFRGAEGGGPGVAPR